MYTIEEALKAINIISRVCSEHHEGFCFMCPYSTGYQKCGIVGSVRDSGEFGKEHKKAPMYWKVTTKISLFEKDEEN